MKLPDLVAREQVLPERFFFLNRDSRAAEFYMGRRIPMIPWQEAVSSVERGDLIWLYVSADGKEALESGGLHPEKILKLEHYDLNRISPKFLNPDSRDKVLEARFVLGFNISN